MSRVTALAACFAFAICSVPSFAQQPPAQQPPAQQPPAQQAPQHPGYYQYPSQQTPQYPKYYQYPPPVVPAPSVPPTPVRVLPTPVREPLVHWHIDGGWSDPVGRTANYLQGGYSVGAGFSVAPAHDSPLDFRFDANYDRNDATRELVALNQNASGAINRGNASIWNGTLDLELHVPFGGGVRGYVFGGGGAYNTTVSFREPFFTRGGYYGGGYYCNPFAGFCGGFGEFNAASHTITKFGWNAGAGLEVPLESGVKFFVEGRYNRIEETNATIPLSFVPITVGLRF
jgi:opacity protein-like surface antigen